MTFTEIQDEIIDRCNLSSASARTRVGRSINERYKELSSSMGLLTTVRTVVSANTVVGNRFVTFAGEKVLSVFNSAFTPARVLREITYNEMRNAPLSADPASVYAVSGMGASTVTIWLNCTPGTIYALGADVEQNQATLSDGNIPVFAESFHNILVYGGMATEYDKMDKAPLAAKFEAKYEKRLGELRLFIAKSAYLDIFQGKQSARRWTPTV